MTLIEQLIFKSKYKVKYKKDYIQLKGFDLKGKLKLNPLEFKNLLETHKLWFFDKKHWEVLLKEKKEDKNERN